MRHQRTYPADRLASPANSKTNNILVSLSHAVAAAILLLAVLIVPSAIAQPTTSIRLTHSQDRITVPINSINTTTVTNFVNLNGVTNASFNVTGLPAGTSYILADTNGAPYNGGLLTPTLTTDTNLWLTVFTTNIPEGLYLFRINAGGTDTNGQPVTNSVPYLLQAAHVWNGTLNTSNAWSTAGNWLTGVPGTTSDVVLGDAGAQTNGFGSPGESGIPFTNSVVDVDTTINSLRFAQSGSTNFSAVATNPPPIFHHIQILPGKTLTVAGTSNSFSMLSDYFAPSGADFRAMNVTIDGSSAKMVVSNQNANVAITLPTAANSVPTLNMSNLDTFIAKVSRIGFADYQLYPNYRDLNTANNAGRDTNSYNPNPGGMSVNVYAAKTNIFSATYKDPNNYTNESTRQYAFTLYNNEIQGISSGTAQNFLLGISNIFLMDGVCFYGANGNASATTGTKFNTSNSFALFRNTNGGSSRMSVFTVADDGGTNEAGSNMKAVVDFSAGTVDILADRMYLSRDRVLISTNQNPNIQATVTFGKGTVDVNTAVFGFQEHTKPDWNVAGHGPYLNYCSGDLTVTSNGLFKVNGTLTLGYTADTNSVNDAQQYNTGGRITINSNSIVAVSNIICDGNLNYYDSGNGRPNQITINSAGTLIISNTIGGNNYVGTDLNTVFNTGLPGLPLDRLAMAPASTLTLFVTPGKTNYVRTFTSTGNSQPGIIKIASLPVFPVYPTNITLIQYTTANPVVLAADMSAVGGTVQGYILNNTANSTIDLFLTTNAPKQLVWTGGINGQWDLTSTNWEPLGGGAPTKYSLGDIAIFDDSSSVTNVLVTDTVVPNQATNGVIITNSANAYTFLNNGGSIAGTAKIIKQGTNLVTFNVAEAGTMFVTAGEVDAGGGAILGTTTVFSNALLKVQGGSTVNGVIATNCPLTVAAGGTINGVLTLVGGSLVNDGTISTPSGLNFQIGTNAVVTNNTFGIITINGSGSSAGGEVFPGSTLANFGTINVLSSRLTIDGTYFGTGSVQDTVNSPSSGSFGRLQYNNFAGALMSPGTNIFDSITNFFVGARLDLSGNNPQNTAPTFRVELDTINNVWDTITAVRWNNIGCIWQMTNVNGTFQSGQSFRILVNAANVALSNFVDTAGIYPLMQPTIPGPGLQWNLTGVHEFGTVGVTNCTMVWAGGGGGSWDTNGTVGAWQNGKVYSDNQGALFDDTASGSTTVTLNTMVAPAGISVVSVTNVVGTTTNVVTTTNTPAFSPGMIVSNALKDYTFIPGASSNRVTGMTSLYKLGPGTLNLFTSNDFTGGMVIDGGTVAITNVSALGIDGPTRPAYDQIMIDNTLLRYYGPNTNQVLGRAFTINSDGATFEVSSNGTVLTMTPANSGVIGGVGTLTKSGPGTLVLGQAADNYSGGTIVTNGTLRLTAAAAGSGSLTFSNNTSWEITNAFTLTNAVNLPAGGLPIALQGIATNVLSTGLWSGGSATFTGTNANRLLVFNSDLSGIAGTISFGTSTSTFRFNNRTNDSPCLGSAATTFDLGTGSALLYNITRTNLTYDLGALAGGPNTTLAGSSSNITGTATTYRIGAKGVDSTFAGTISNGLDTVSVVKVGAGKLLLNGKSIYTGSTTVSNGTLGGTGSIASPLTVASGGTLSPGAPLGTFTVSNTAALNGSVLMQLNVSSSPASNSTLAVTGTITATGTLVVTNVGPDIVNGSKFQLFNKGVTGFSSVTLPASNPSNTSSYNWQNDIGANGSITLISGGTSSVNTNPTNMTFSVSGNTLTLTWPGDHQGWQLQSNPISLTTTDWYQIVGSTSVTQETLTIDHSKTNVFFRMIYPPVP